VCSGVRQAIARFTENALDKFAGFLCAHFRRHKINLFMYVPATTTSCGPHKCAPSIALTCPRSYALQSRRYLWGPMVAMFCAELSPSTTSVVSAHPSRRQLVEETVSYVVLNPCFTVPHCVDLGSDSPVWFRHRRALLLPGSVRQNATTTDAGARHEIV